MEKERLDEAVTDAVRAIHSYAVSRTNNVYDAEDLASEIIFELYKSATNLRDDGAFYGFMWGVASNVYKSWCRKRNRRDVELSEEIEKTLVDDDGMTDENDGAEDITLLRRELTLLSKKYREATVLYYIQNKSCDEISKFLSISESMVKYLLFKSRQKLKEGMNMERNYGTQSYDPKELALCYWGSGSNEYYDVGKGKLAQNILFAAYNDKLTEEAISLEIGVGLPYMEENLAELLKYGLLIRDGKRYSTNIPIITAELSREISQKTAGMKQRIADMVESAVSENEAVIREIGFYGSDMSKNAFAWQMSSILISRAILEIYGDKMQIEFPERAYGGRCLVWGEEIVKNNRERRGDFMFGVSDVSKPTGEGIKFMDFPINGDMVHHYFFGHESIANVFLDIAKGKCEFSENDAAVAAELVKKGYAISDNGKLYCNAPIYTKEEIGKLGEILEPLAQEIADEAMKLSSEVESIVREHLPSHLRKEAHNMAYFRLFEDAVSSPMEILYERRFLRPVDPADILPTTYVVIN